MVENPEKYVDEGTSIAETEHYKCMADGFSFFVMFKSFTNNQILVIKPKVSTNLEPDGGCTFMKQNVLEFVDSLVSDKKYI